MHHPTDRIAHSTAVVTLVLVHWLEREIAQWVHHERSIRRPILPRSYISLPDRRMSVICLHAGERCSSVVRAFVHGAMGRRIDPSWGEPIELFLLPSSAPRLV